MKGSFVSWVFFVALALAPAAHATEEPQPFNPLGIHPGALYREYRWSIPNGDAGGSLRVGGKLDYGGKPIEFAYDADLDDAIRAELVIEKLLCHDNTQGLEVSLNEHEWIAVPEAAGIAEPQCDYQHFTYPVIPVPLDQLKDEGVNTFALRVSEEHAWNWPQNLIHGVHLRVYYDPEEKRHTDGFVSYPSPGTALGQVINLEVSSRLVDNLVQVDYVGFYDGVNWEGDGIYQQWHGHYFQGELRNHLGTSTEYPFSMSWETDWLPDQSEPIKLAARLTDFSGLIYGNEINDELTLNRSFSVELCKPYDVPVKWVTRREELAQKVKVSGDLEKAKAARLLWSSWSPGYMEGLFINDTQVFEREGPRYKAYWHNVPLENLAALKDGENIIKTGKTPKYKGKTVHGMEVNWPGIMLLIKYAK